jgi:hypothetical protein
LYHVVHFTVGLTILLELTPPTQFTGGLRELGAVFDELATVLEVRYTFLIEIYFDCPDLSTSQFLVESFAEFK